MPTQGEFWILVLVGLLIANLVFRFYVRLDLDKKINELLQEVRGVKENLANDKNVSELLREVKSIKESLLYVKQDFDKRIIELLQEVSDIKAGKNAGELVQQVKDVKENLIHIQQNFGNKLMDLLQEVNDIKGRLILDLDKKINELSLCRYWWNRYEWYCAGALADGLQGLRLGPKGEQKHGTFEEHGGKGVYRTQGGKLGGCPGGSRSSLRFILLTIFFFMAE